MNTYEQYLREQRERSSEEPRDEARKAFEAPQLNKQGDLPVVTAGSYEGATYFSSDF